MPLFGGPSILNSKDYTMHLENMDDIATSTSGAGAAVADQAQTGFFEVRRFETGTTTTGSAGIRGNKFRGGAGECWLNFGTRPSTLSTAAEEYTLEIGIHNGNATTAVTDGVFFRYDRTTNTEWLAISENSSTETSTASGVTVQANTDVDLTIYINSDNTSVEYFIDNALVATHTTNLPNTGSMFFAYKILKSAGTTERTCLATYISGVIKR